MHDASCKSFEGSGRLTDKPPCRKLQHFITEGDALYLCTYHYCHDCQRIWCHTDSTYLPTDYPYWELTSLTELQAQSFDPWIGEPELPEGLFSKGIEGFEQWLAGVHEAWHFVKPI
jgi:hypothetical protein